MRLLFIVAITAGFITIGTTGGNTQRESWLTDRQQAAAFVAFAATANGKKRKPDPARSGGRSHELG
jgi:hypothetical protein